MRPDTRKEWLVTNGLGGYAFGAADGRPSRRYHGLLIAARRPPVERRMLFAALLLSAETASQAVLLDPSPDRPASGAIVDFSLEPLPTFIYEWQEAGGRTCRLIRTLSMRYEHNVTLIQYRLDRGGAVHFSLRILPGLRDHHAIDSAMPAAGGVTAKTLDHRQVVFSRGDESAWLWHSRGAYVPDPKVIGPARYDWETRQGMEDTEWFDSPGRIVFDLNPGGVLEVILSDGPVRSPQPDRWRDAEIRRRRFTMRLRPQGRTPAAPVRKILSAAADQFLVRRTPGRKRTIVAGYPWFTDWGRDTMISLEGLTLVRREWKAARDILAAFAGAESQGMIPNHYPDAGEEPHYNTVDASLWFFEAGWKYLAYSRDHAFVRRKLFPVFQSIIQHHLAGTRFNIKADPDTGLLFSGEEGTQLTWMDAKVGDWVVTPRHGFPVEIQALWYNALRIFCDLSTRFGGPGKLVESALEFARRGRTSFQERYWYPAGSHLYDCLRPDGAPVADLRPNQLIAMSLTHPILEDRKRGKKILAAVRRKLLTPVGLRTLSPDHPDYKGRHAGARLDRDAAYHQGTVWPWLLGPYARACVRVEGGTAKTRQHLRGILNGFRRHLSDCVMGTVSEIFDGDPPHEPKGCVAQAWSVAELLVMSGLAAKK